MVSYKCVIFDIKNVHYDYIIQLILQKIKNKNYNYITGNKIV